MSRPMPPGMAPRDLLLLAACQLASVRATREANLMERSNRVSFYYCFPLRLSNDILILIYKTFTQQNCNSHTHKLSRSQLEPAEMPPPNANVCLQRPITIYCCLCPICTPTIGTNNHHRSIADRHLLAPSARLDHWLLLLRSVRHHERVHVECKYR